MDPPVTTGSPAPLRSRRLLRDASRRLPMGVRASLRRGVAALPPAVRERVEAAVAPARPRAVRPRWGNLRSLRPFSADFGWDRGTPVDRVAIEAFLAAHAADVRGDCLEVLDRTYVDRFGGAQVRHCDVLDIDPHNPLATVVADLGEPGSLPRERYDCVVLNQTLHLIPAYETALANAYAALRPGGVLLLTVPAVSPHQPDGSLEHDLWRFTPAGLAHLLARLLPDADCAVQGYGNLVTCVAFLQGIVAEELTPAELAAVDPRFPLVAAARVAKPGSANLGVPQ